MGLFNFIGTVGIILVIYTIITYSENNSSKPLTKDSYKNYPTTNTSNINDKVRDSTQGRYVEKNGSQVQSKQERISPMSGAGWLEGILGCLAFGVVLIILFFAIVGFLDSGFSN